MEQTHRRTTMQKRDLNKAALQLYGNYSTSAEYSTSGEHLWGLRLYVKGVLKDLNYKTLLFTVVKRNFIKNHIEKGIKLKIINIASAQ